MGHEKEGEGIEFEFSSSSRSLESIFWGRGGGGAPVHFEFAFVSQVTARLLSK